MSKKGILCVALAVALPFADVAKQALPLPFEVMKGSSAYAAVIDPLYVQSPLVPGTRQTFALMNDGTIQAVGQNTSAQLGFADYVNRSAFETVTLLGTGVKQIASGNESSFALLTDGTVLAWGKNSYGQLGFGDTTNRVTPTKIPGLTGVKAIYCSKSGSSVFALMEDGTVKSWGYNYYGHLGLGSTTDKYSPTTIPALSNVKRVVVGHDHNAVILNDGTVKIWGFNLYGQLGFGDKSNRSSPTAIATLSGVKDLSLGLNFSVALFDNGIVKTWGRNITGELGLGDKTDRTTPTVVPGVSSVTQVSSGGQHVLALRNDGTVYSWGLNFSGQLGLGDTNERLAPLIIPNFSGIKRVDASYEGSFAISTRDEMYGWGNNSLGEAGIGSNNPSRILSPMIVTLNKPLTGAFSIEASATPSSPTEIKLNYQGSGSVAKFIVKRGTTQVYSGTNATYTDGGLTPGTAYTYTVEAYDAANNLLGSKTANATTQAYTLTATATATSPSAIRIDYSGNAARYVVKRGATTVYDGANATFTDSGLTASTNYSYTVSAYDSAGNLLGTVLASATTQFSLTATATTTSPVAIKIDYQGSGTVAKYIVKRGTTQVYAGTNATYTDGGLTPGTAYTYTVEAYDAANNLLGSKTANATTQAYTLTATATPTSPGAIRIDYSGNAAVAWYAVKRGATTVYDGANATYTDSGLAASTNYSYTVTAYDAAGNLLGTATASATTQDLPSVPVTNLKLDSIGAYQLVLSWDPLHDSTYVVERYRDGVLEKRSSLSSTNFTDSTVTPETTYRYVVRSVRNGVESSPVSIDATTKADQPIPLSLTAESMEATLSSIKMSWHATDGAYHKVLVRLNDQLVFTGGPGQSGEYTAIGLQPKQSYIFMIECYDSRSRLVGAKNVMASTKEFQVNGLMVTGIDSKKIELKWEVPNGATSYQLQRIKDGKTELTKTLPVGQVSYIDTTVQPGTAYTYEIRPIQNTIVGNPVTVNAKTQSVLLPPVPKIDVVRINEDGVVEVTASGTAPNHYLVIEDESGKQVRRLSITNMAKPRTTKGLPTGRYRVKVEAFDRKLKASSFSSYQVIEITPEMVAPPIPQQVTAKVVTEGRFTVLAVESNVSVSAEEKLYFYLLNEKGAQVATGVGRVENGKISWTLKQESTKWVSGTYKVVAKGHKYGVFSAPVHTQVTIQGIAAFPNPNTPHLQSVKVNEEGVISAVFTSSTEINYLVILNDEGKEVAKVSALSGKEKAVKGLPAGVYTVLAQSKDSTYLTTTNSTQMTVEITQEMVEPPYPDDLKVDVELSGDYVIIKCSVSAIASEEARMIFNLLDVNGKKVTYGTGRVNGSRVEWTLRRLKSTLPAGTYTVEAIGFKYGQYSEPDVIEVTIP